MNEQKSKQQNETHDERLSKRDMFYDDRHPEYDSFTKTGHYGHWDDFLKVYVED